MAIKKTAKRKHGKMQKGGSNSNSNLVAQIQQQFRSARKRNAQSAAAVLNEVDTRRGSTFTPTHKSVNTLTRTQALKLVDPKTGKLKTDSPYFSGRRYPTVSNLVYDAFTPEGQQKLVNAGTPNLRIKGLKTRTRPAVFNTGMPPVRSSKPTRKQMTRKPGKW